MSLSVGIVGLPNVGKSTLFKALTKNPVAISNYPFCTIEPNVGIVEVPDERLEKLQSISQAEKIIPAIIKFVDIAGLVKGAAKGEGLGNQFLAHIREVDAILHIVRCFKREDVSHINQIINPERDIEIINSELILKDLETIEKRLEKIASDVKTEKKEAIEEEKILIQIKENLEKGKLAIYFSSPSHLFLLTAKPQIYLLNGKEKEAPNELKEKLEREKQNYLIIDLQEELDISELNEEERREFNLKESKLNILIEKCYNILNLITFFTIVGKEETRAWPIKKGTKIIEAAELIHSDFAEKFILAEVINFEDLIKSGGWKECQEKGMLKTVGRDELLKNGDIVEIKHH
ncbi:redox-regulated ATPase YchF [bacterium (Candidatus Gribaldobacteria) CG07_land_8_20_14_0_80_33_18]|uniref:Redox-regulated ATPase YchF n=1 Tax=bacterium (Candidatus Gribaldobacteria) CG07_land_8_20_14_0_80_33_18 TaxID=2014272 RepID=A0A2M6Z3T7_9BACT|nr:MAG: redox-regulated ATPase YchF [bacterium (Candidatus Gribaldobacteria) CG10_big_fil_rev_8_21_14_0_10_33_41]PIU47068.1 MAG: redox-regulated ATPase YchF [bacterium (Candidatus Gribaldobacteria) CG07_land_8_20_14_0_80_33_18]PJA01298.1 MAG: redox-regulated ATPase YchF [bacterium (Candidatus Gribaldobacteria) CG_4_10_14_0_2_um_filter_33_15]PJB08989.1 MAG: redox-regulated ATPase YchF [bacterium (Candidatus Gribaldobacteria) CG_4_9_14_3_um_filter_33_9]